MIAECRKRPLAKPPSLYLGYIGHDCHGAAKITVELSGKTDQRSD